MPSTSDEVQHAMERAFPKAEFEHGLDTAAINFLHSRGYTEVDGLIHKPTSSHTVGPYEMLCIVYLVEEWDYAFTYTSEYIKLLEECA